MTLSIRLTTIAAAVSLALPGALQAQQQTQQPQAQQQKSKQGQLSRVQASRLKDMKVVDKQGKEIGEISEIVVDMTNGRLHAAVLEFGGVMGMGEKQFAFAPTHLRPGSGRDQVVLDIDRRKLENAQGFAKDQWPAMGDEYWGRVGKEGGGTSARLDKDQGGLQRNLMRVSEVIGKDVQDKQGEEIGEVQDVILDLGQGRVRNVVLEMDDGGRVTVQPKALSLGREGDKFVTSMNRDQLRQQAGRGGAAAGGTRPRGNGDVGVLGPTQKDRGPWGAAEMGTIPGKQQGTEKPEKPAR